MAQSPRSQDATAAPDAALAAGSIARGGVWEALMTGIDAPERRTLSSRVQAEIRSQRESHIAASA